MLNRMNVLRKGSISLLVRILHLRIRLPGNAEAGKYSRFVQQSGNKLMQDATRFEAQTLQMLKELRNSLVSA